MSMRHLNFLNTLRSNVFNSLSPPIIVSLVFCSGCQWRLTVYLWLTYLLIPHCLLLAFVTLIVTFLLYQTWKLLKTKHFRCSRALSCFLSWNGRGIVWRLWLWRVRIYSYTPIFRVSTRFKKNSKKMRVETLPIFPKTQTCHESPCQTYENGLFEIIWHLTKWTIIYIMYILYILTLDSKRRFFHFRKKRKITKSIRLLIIGTFHFFVFATRSERR